MDDKRAKKRWTVIGLLLGGAAVAGGLAWDVVGQPLLTKWFENRGIVNNPEEKLSYLLEILRSAWLISGAYVEVALVALVFGVVIGVMLSPFFRGVSVRLFSWIGRGAGGIILSPPEKKLVQIMLSQREHILIYDKTGRVSSVRLSDHKLAQEAGELSEAQAQTAFHSLIQKGLLHDRFGRGEVFELTPDGLALAHKLLVNRPH